RARPVRHSRAHDRARPVSHPAAAQSSRRESGEPRGLRAVPQAARRSARVRRHGDAHRAQPLPQRRGDPPRRRAAHGAALTHLMPSLVNRRTVRIEWGDCDPMGIVFFPRYLAMFDDSTAYLFERALGITKYKMMQVYDFAGFPLVDVRARFLMPTRFGEDGEFESSVGKLSITSFTVKPRLR